MRSSRAVIIAALLIPCLACLAQQANPITNGSFEQLGPDGWALDWERVGLEVSITADAHSGQHAVLLNRTAEAIEKKVETGLNRLWKPNSGQQGTMLSQRKGGVIFWYKVPQAPKTAHLRFFIIPMSADPMENTGGQRAWYEVPADHLSDGQWHEGKVAYDFTDNEKCRWVHISPRIISDEPAQWIIDDIEWVESIGPLATIAGTSVEEVKGREGRECEIGVSIKNTGDKPLQGTAELQLPDYLRVTGPAASQTVGPLPPGDTVKVKWQVAGLRDRKDTISVRFTGGGAPAGTIIVLEPKLSEVWLETEQFILWPGKETRVSLVVQNNGTAVASGLKASLQAPAEVEILGESTATLEAAAPCSLGRVDFRLRARQQTPSAWLICSWGAPDGVSGSVRTELIVGTEPPKPRALPKDAASLSCATFDLVFPKNQFGYGIGWIFTRPGGELAGALPYLGRAVVKASDEKTVNLYAEGFEPRAAVTPLGATKADLQRAKPSGMIFTVTDPDLQRLGLTGPIRISLATAVEAEASSTLGKTITYEVSCAAPRTGILLALEGPRVCVGEGSFGNKKTEALYPGLEWLEAGEDSSSTLDIAADHEHRLRYVVHPHMVTIPCMGVLHGKTCVGLLWHSRSRWADGKNRADLTPDRSDVDRPSALFASPDKPAGHGSQAMGLFVPTVPEYVPANKRVAEKPWPAEGVDARQVRLVSAIYVNPDSSSAMDPMRAWFDIYGVAAPRALPHVKGPATPEATEAAPQFRGYELPAWAQAATRQGKWAEPARSEWIDEVEWSMQAYLKTLWDDEEKGWMPHKGGPTLGFRISPNPSYLYDCVLGARLTDDADLRREIDDRVMLVKSLYPGVVPQADDLGFNFGEPVHSLVGMSEASARLIRSQGPDGSWRFHTRVETAGTFKGMDYAELGYEGQEANGLVARNAYTLLRFARMTGDQQALEAGLKTLNYMEKFRVPRAAQVWEVPVHTPDVLASSDACEACLEAYQITGDRKWLERAVYWEETGLPFLYQWDVDAYPWLRYGSIPVFGASWNRWSWFGRPVQWNGLRWAFAALRLAEVDTTYPWRMLAAGVTVSGIYQQGDGEKDLALWPDSISAIDATKSGWIFAPRAILKNVYRLLGHEPEPLTTSVKFDGGTVLINACGAIDNAVAEGDTLRFKVIAPEPVPTRVVLCGLGQPQTVKVNGAELPSRDVLGPGEVVGWTYHVSYSILEISPGKPGEFQVEVSPARYRVCNLMPQEISKIEFEFDRDDGGWRPTHDLAPFSLADGCLVVTTTGPDPYMVRSNCNLDGNSVNRVHVRMAVSAGDATQWFWATEDAPTMAEDKKIDTPIQADGEFHDYYFDVGAHELWRGKKITAIRLDPTSGAAKANIRIDFIRGEP